MGRKLLAAGAREDGGDGALNDDGERSSGGGGASGEPAPSGGAGKVVYVDLTLSPDDVANHSHQPGGGEGAAAGGGGGEGSSGDGGGAGGEARGAVCTLSVCHCRSLGSDCSSMPINGDGLGEVIPKDLRAFRGIPAPGEVRLLPNQMRQDLLEQATLELNKLVAGAAAAVGALDGLLVQHGFAVVRRETLRQLVSGYDPMLEAAHAELAAQLASRDGQFEGKAFHNLSKKNMDADIGNGSRTLGKLTEGGPCWRLINAVIAALTHEEHRILRSIEGILQIQGIHQEPNDHPSENPQIAHMDHLVNPKPHGRPSDDISVPNLNIFSDPRTAVRALWLNAQPGTEIRLGLFGQSHTVAQVCERTYARHYSDLRREAFDNHGITEDAFLPLWAQIQAGWLREQLPEQEPAQSATVSTNFGDIIFMAANFAHYGTGDGGLRLVASSVHREYYNTFVHVNESICILDESQVYSAMRAVCLPDATGIPSAKLSANLSTQLAAAFTNRGDTRRNVAHVGLILDSILRPLDSEQRDRCRPVAGQTIVRIGDGLAGVQLKEGCNKKRVLIMWVDIRRTDGTGGAGVSRALRGSVMRHAMVHSNLVRRIKRSDHVSVAAPAWDDRFAGRGRIAENTTICYSVMEYAGEPLERMFAFWDDRRELREEFRWSLQALFRGVEDLWAAGWRFVYFHHEMLVIDIVNGKEQVKLVMAGCGYLGPTDATVRDGNLGPGSHVIAAGRKSTTAFGDARQEDIPKSVDKKHLKNFKRLNALALAEEERRACLQGNEELPQDHGEGAEELHGEVAEELLKDDVPEALVFGWHHLSSAYDRLKRTKSGCPHQPPRETFADRDLWDLVFEKGMHNLNHEDVKFSDLHQLILWIAFRFQKIARKPPLQQVAFAEKCTELMEIDGEEFREEAIDFVLKNSFNDGPRLAGNRQNCTRPQPGQHQAVRRIAETLALVLFPRERADVLGMLSYMPCVSLPIFSPNDEARLSGSGVPIKASLFPIPDGKEVTDETGVVISFRAMALKAIKDAGLVAPAEDTPMLLKTEGDMGVGAQLQRDCDQNAFAGFYIGRGCEDGSRFSVTTPGKGEVKEVCDAVPCKDLPLSWYIESGVPCPFFNASRTEEEANIKLFRENLFVVYLNKTRLICIPMGFKKYTTAGSFAAWKYTHDAVRGRSLKY